MAGVQADVYAWTQKCFLNQERQGMVEKNRCERSCSAKIVKSLYCLPLGIPGPSYPPLDAGSAAQPGDQAATNTVLKAKSLSLTGLARVLPFWSTMVMASPDVSDRGPLVV